MKVGPFLFWLVFYLLFPLSLAASVSCYAAIKNVCHQPPPGTKTGSTAYKNCAACTSNHLPDIDIGGCVTGDQRNFCRGQDISTQPPGGYPHHEVPNPGITAGRPIAYDCQVRKLAWEYAQHLQLKQRGINGLKSVYDALQLEHDCGKDYSWKKILASGQTEESDILKKQKSHTINAINQIFVDPVHGDNSNPGTKSAPVRTVVKALQLVVDPTEKVKEIVLRSGTHVLEETLKIEPGKHDNLTITNYNNEKVIMTGVKPLKVHWQPYKNFNGLNIWMADLNDQGNLGEFVGLRIADQRAIRARYPNSNPEKVQPNTSYIQAWTHPVSWIEPKQYPDAITYTTVGSKINRRKMTGAFGDYYVGAGGACSIYSPPESYWCSNHSAGGGAFTFRVPSGVKYSLDALPHAKNYTDPVGDGCILNIYRPARWSNWMFKISSFNKTHIMLGDGGFQGARGDNFGGDWFIENVREELDAPNEFFFDKRNNTLYYFHSDVGQPPISGVGTPLLKTLISVVGTQALPLKGLTISGVTFTGSAATYMDPHGVPSGGDWGLQRSGALFFEGINGLEISNCVLTRLDGHGIFLSGYVRNAIIQSNEFSWIGDTAMAAWGYTRSVPVPGTSPSIMVEGADGTDGNQPRGTKILYNLIRELGHYQKQSSAWFQAKTARTLLKGNIFFNGPRAGVNFNDGFGGGNILDSNLIFNFCRESSDHGPFNSWDRQPFITKLVDGQTPSMEPLYNHIYHNLLIANYESSMCVDNDDGSAFYDIHDNVCAYGGHKSDFDGHHKRTYNSLDIFPKHDRCLRVMYQLAGPQGVDGYWNNTCLQLGEGDGKKESMGAYTQFDACDVNGTLTHPEQLPTLHNNTIYQYTKDGPWVDCSSYDYPWSVTRFSLADWQKANPASDLGTFSRNKMLEPKQVYEMGRKVLLF